MKTTKFISIIENVKERERVVCLLQRGTKMFFAVLIRREYANKEKYTCIYIGLNRVEYEYIRRDTKFVESLPGYFIGVSNDTIDVKQITADKLMIPKPSHYVGFVKPPAGDLQITILAFADSVQDRLDGFHDESA